MLTALAVAVPSASAAGRCGTHAWCDTRLSPDVRAERLLSALTPDERIELLAGDELTGVLGGDHTHTGTSNGVPRVGLPPVYFSDGPVGPRQGLSTAQPIPMGLAATFDPRLANLAGQIVAAEARGKGNDVVLAPTVNILRTPRWGRAFETYGEDPFLSGRLAVGWVQGAQSKGVIANVKHYAANNQEGVNPAADASRSGEPFGPPATEGNRLTVDVRADERTLREIYLPQFEAAVKQGRAGSIMCSYNRLNGQYACENEFLLRRVLQRDWGFKGFVLADYGAAKNTGDSLRNGLDFDPWPAIAYDPRAVRAALATGQATPAHVDEHVRRILRTLFAYGFFDRAAYRDDDRQINQAAHLRSVTRIEERAITLLRNRGSLPLDASRLRSIALIGVPANQFKTGSGSAAVRPFSYVTPREALARRAGPGVQVRYDDGSDAARAAALARGSDVAIVFAADHQTEFTDRNCLSLQCPPIHGDQDALIEQVAAANRRTIVVLETGGPVLTPWRERVDAIVEAWYPGMGGGTAIARVLFGDVDPGGRLPATFPAREADLPTAGDPEKYPGVAETVHYKEGVLVGYRWFDARRLQPAYPFGFGLSYTRFALRGLRVRATGPTSATASIEVVNTGERAGNAVPQLYLGLPSPGPGIVQPPRQLRGFRSLHLGRGRARRIAFPIGARALSYWDVRTRDWRVAPGCYEVTVAQSSRDAAAPRARLAVGGARCGNGAVRLA
ncbi:MAG TPA: glycoside hydrolase family 3 C-terminal domain-containing protein [Solirubrobacteraceae bacterium]|nr:glycoside hydrolase family 3 C-terminal domain-containing protein [Solirubrobacteraceae bacterium]